MTLHRSCYERLLVAEQELSASTLHEPSGPATGDPPAGDSRALAAQRAARCLALMYKYASKQEVSSSTPGHMA